jgi:hypothetical protein
MVKEKQAPVYIFILFSLIIVFHHLFGYFGHYGYDDMHYAEIARNLLHGTINFDLAFTHRFTLVFFTFLSYSVFGINDFASALPSIIVSIAILFVVYLSLRKQGSFQTIVGLTLTVFINIFLFYTDKIMPDIYVALFLLISVYCIDKHRSAVVKKDFQYAGYFTLSLFLAFISKETAVLFLPFPMVLLLIDISNRKNSKFWIYSLISGLLIMVVYLGVMEFVSGSYLKRFEVLSSANQAHTYLYSYDKQPVAFLLKRIGYQLLEVYLKEGILLPYIFVFAMLASRDLRSLIKVNSTFSLYMLASIVLLLSLNFMSISPFSYHPVPLDPRHSIFIIPIAAIAASYIVKDFLTEKKYKWQIIGISVLATIISIFLLKTIWQNTYFWLTLLVTAYGFARSTHKLRYKIVFITLFLLVISIVPRNSFNSSRLYVKYGLQKEVLHKYLIRSNEKCYVFTDPMQRNIGKYYLGFDDNANCTFIYYNNINNIDLNPDYKKYLLLNWHTQTYSNTLHKIPYFARNIHPSYILIYENKNQGISLYEIPELLIPEIAGTKLLETLNDFEQEYQFWTYDTTTITDTRKYSGEKSSVIPEYSPLFAYQLDSDRINDSGNLFIKINFQCFFHTTTTSNLVVSVENEERVYFWEAKKIDNDIKIMANWNNVSHEFIYDNEDLRSNSVLKIYIWNPGFDQGYLDDFHIVIYEMK